MTKLNITGLKEKAIPLGPNTDGTYAHIGARGGTEMMAEQIRNRVDSNLLDKFNIIHSRVRPESISSSKKNILVLHDTWDDPESEHLRSAESRARFTKLVFVSHHQQATYNLGLGVPYSDGVVIQNAITPIEFTDADKKSDKIKLIYHTTPHRGLEILVPVFELLAKNIPNLHLDVFSSFNIYGWGERDKQYEGIFERIKTHPNMTYHGYQSNDVVREALKSAHIYGYPNIWPETSCISMIEAMSAGCAIVAPNFAVLPETCANFATMYGFNEDYNKHANIFANVLNMMIFEYWSESVQNKLKFQKLYIDNFYNWNLRASQWNGLLKSLN